MRPVSQVGARLPGATHPSPGKVVRLQASAGRLARRANSAKAEDAKPRGYCAESGARHAGRAAAQLHSRSRHVSSSHGIRRNRDSRTDSATTSPTPRTTSPRTSVAATGNNAPSGSHYNLNIIGVPSCPFQRLLHRGSRPDPEIKLTSYGPLVSLISVDPTRSTKMLLPLKSADLSLGTPMMLRSQVRATCALLPVAATDVRGLVVRGVGEVVAQSQAESVATASVAICAESRASEVHVRDLCGDLIGGSTRRGALQDVTERTVASWLCVLGFRRVCPCRKPAGGCLQAKVAAW